MHLVRYIRIQYLFNLIQRSNDIFSLFKTTIQPEIKATRVMRKYKSKITCTYENTFGYGGEEDMKYLYKCNSTCSRYV